MATRGDGVLTSAGNLGNPSLIPSVWSSAIRERLGCAVKFMTNLETSNVTLAWQMVRSNTHLTRS